MFVLYISIEYLPQSYFLGITQVQHVVPEITIPPEVTAANVTMYIVDTGCMLLYSNLNTHIDAPFAANAQDRAHLESEIRKAHVICVVYAIDNPLSFDRIPNYWLPYFRQLGVNVCPIPASLVNTLIYCNYCQVPVILVGNKIDLRSGEVTNEALEEEIAPIMKEFKV